MAKAVIGAIPFSRYINIVSGVGGAQIVAERELIGRLFSNNQLIPPQSFLEFSNAADVALYFGSTSDEYLRAAFYFGWVSKNITQAKKISFARWVSVGVGSQIHGKIASYSLSALTAISSGGFGLTLGGFTHELSGVSLSGLGSLSDVAAAVQAAIRAYSAGGDAWTGATVSYNSTRGSFDLVSGTTGTDVIAVTAAAEGVDLASALGWLTGAVLCNGSNVETLTEALNTSAGLSNNFGSYLFLQQGAFTANQFEEIALWNNTNNNLYMFCLPVTAANAAVISAGIMDYEGCAMSLSLTANEYPEMVPMVVLAATDYTKANAVQNYMYQHNFNLTPSVLNSADANTYDALRVNYYGQTQYAGQYLAFYQRGVLTGGDNAPTDINTYANEMWLKTAMAASLMNLLIALAQVSANLGGKSQIMAQLMSVVKLALKNGTISVGKTLNQTQKAAVTTYTTDPDAWQQVQNIGYWLGLVIEEVVNDESHLTEYQATYTLVYAQNNAIRSVSGTHILI